MKDFWMVTKRSSAVDAFKNLQKYAIPAFVAVVVATGWQVRNDMEISRHDAAIKSIREQLHSICNSGASGFLHPVVRGAHNTHSRVWHEELFGKSGFRKLVNEYSTATDD